MLDQTQVSEHWNASNVIHYEKNENLHLDLCFVDPEQGFRSVLMRLEKFFLTLQPN
jgi:hypothetical protein